MAEKVYDLEFGKNREEKKKDSCLKSLLISEKYFRLKKENRIEYIGATDILKTLVSL